MALWSGEGRSGGTTENVCASSILRRTRAAAQLRSQLQEVVERERRARVRNRRLLQDFQRAQDVLDELAARTAVMAAIREEYERQLEQHYPQWQLKFEEGRTAAHQREVMLLLKEALRKMEENGKREACQKASKGPNSPFSSLGASLLSLSPSHCHSSPIIPHKSRNGEAGLHVLQKGNKAGKENVPLKCPGCSFRWMEAQSRPGVSPSSNIQNLYSSSDLRGFQDFSRAGYQYPQHCQVSQHFNPSYMPPQEQPRGDSVMGFPPGWPGLCHAPRLQSTYSQVPWPGFPIVDPRCWSMAVAHEPVAKGDSASSREERERSEGPESTSDDLQGRKRLPKTSNQSFELDVKPVRLPSARGDSSECSSVCSVAPGGGTAEMHSRKRKERQGGMPQKGMNREDATSLAVARLRSSAESKMSPSSGSGIIRDKNSRATIEARNRKGDVPLSTAPSTEEEGNRSQEEASGGAGTESGGGVHQGSEGHSQRDGEITSEEDEDGEEEMAEEREKGERKMVVEGGAEHDVPDEEEGSQEEVKGEVSSSSSCSVDSAAAAMEGEQEQVGKRLKILAKEVEEEDASSERNGSSEEEEESEREQEESGEEDGGSLGQQEDEEEEEEEEEADEQQVVNQGDSRESEGDSSRCSEEGEGEEDEESEEGDDAVQEEEEADEEGSGTGDAIAVPADNRKEESEGTTTDSEDEIITSQLLGRSDVTGIRCKTIIAHIEEEEEDDVEEVAEEENHENESDIETESQDDYENASDDDIEGILAPGGDSSIPEVPVAEEFEDPIDHTPPKNREAEDKATDPQRDGVTPPPGNKAKAQIITVKSKGKALWQDSDSELEEEVPRRTDLTLSVKDDLEDLDDFYD